jgi:fatty-acyl-CoA synthase
MLKNLAHLHLFSPKILFALLVALLQHGINPITLLASIARLYPEKNALVTPTQTVSYRDLCQQSLLLACYLKDNFGIKRHHRVGILCRNSVSFVHALFAASRLGAHVYLLNVEMTSKQLQNLTQNAPQTFDLLIHDDDLTPLLQEAHYEASTLCVSAFAGIPQYETSLPRLSRVSLSKITVLSGGTTGDFKTASRKVGLFNFLNPFLSLMEKVNPPLFSKTYIAVPLYHGYGLAALFFALSLAAEIHLLPRFEVEKAADCIKTHRIGVLVVVPLMLHRLLEGQFLDKSNTRDLAHIISGGAALSASLVAKTQSVIGHKLYNLYGTSEAGFAILATPDDLKIHPDTLGKPILGVKIERENPGSEGVGEMVIRSNLRMLNSGKKIKTGDLGYLNAEGYCFLCGRIDDMIVSGGENVYPFALERALAEHKEIRDVAVIGIDDVAFGQRLKAFVVVKPSSSLDEKTLLAWLKPRVARFEMPKAIVFVSEIPYTPLGKADKKVLRKE